MEKHPSFGYASKEDIQAIIDAPSPQHRKAMKKELRKKTKKMEERAKKKGAKK